METRTHFDKVCDPAISFLSAIINMNFLTVDFAVLIENELFSIP